MKLNLIDITSCPGLLSDKLKSDIRINSINSNIKDGVISFLYNNGVNRSLKISNLAEKIVDMMPNLIHS